RAPTPRCAPTSRASAKPSRHSPARQDGGSREPNLQLAEGPDVSAIDWISRGAALWRPGFEAKASAGASREPKPTASAQPSATSHAPAARTTRERLQATWRKGQEALSPRVLRRTLTELQAIVDPRASEVEGGRRAKAFAERYATASAEERRDAWLLASEQFGPDPKKIQAAREHYEAAHGTPEEGAAEIRLRRALVSPRPR